MMIQSEVLIIIQVSRIILIDGFLGRTIYSGLFGTTCSRIIIDVTVPCIERDGFRYILVILVFVV